jgi:hypothetical protein
MHWLKRRPYALSHVRRHHDCQLEYRHDGPHADVGQHNEDLEWWVRWTLSSSAVEQVTACMAMCEEPEEPEEPGEEAYCLLFDGHPGRHSFDLDQ